MSSIHPEGSPPPPSPDRGRDKWGGGAAKSLSAINPAGLPALQK